MEAFSFGKEEKVEKHFKYIIIEVLGVGSVVLSGLHSLFAEVNKQGCPSKVSPQNICNEDNHDFSLKKHKTMSASKEKSLYKHFFLSLSLFLLRVPFKIL